MNRKHKIIVAVTGASGAIYAKVLFDKLLRLQDQIEEVGVLMSDNAKYVWETVRPTKKKPTRLSGFSYILTKKSKSIL